MVVGCNYVKCKIDFPEAVAKKDIEVKKKTVDVDQLSCRDCHMVETAHDVSKTIIIRSCVMKFLCSKEFFTSQIRR